MTVRVGINGFGRIGRLVVRALRDQPNMQLVHINDVAGDAATAAHLLEFDTVHGRYAGTVSADGNGLSIDDSEVTYSSHDTPGAVPWAEHGVDVVLECSGKFKSTDALEPYLDHGVAFCGRRRAAGYIVVRSGRSWHSPGLYGQIAGSL